MMVKNDEANNEIGVLDGGIRYRKKRRHCELNQGKENDQENEEYAKQIKSKKFKISKSKNEAPIIISREDNFQNQEIKNLKPTVDNQSLMENNNIINKNINNNLQLNSYNNISKSKEQKNELSKNNKDSKKLLADDNNLNASFPRFKQENENKITLQKEYEKIKNILEKLEIKFNEEKIPLLVQKLSAFCNKNAKNKNLKIKSNIIFKFAIVLNLFNDEKFILENRIYSHKYILINLEMLFIESFLSKNNLYENILENESPSIGNLFLYYFGQNCLIKILNSFLPIMFSNIEKYSDVQVIKLPETENIFNENKLLCINTLFNL